MSETPKARQTGQSPPAVAGQRPSKTARAMLEAKLRRVDAMTPRERMMHALMLGLAQRRLLKRQSPP